MAELTRPRPLPGEPSLETNAPSVQIVIDRSEVMNQPFGPARTTGVAKAMSKLDEARRAVLKAVENMGDSDNLALRIFGGECGAPGNTQLLLPFGPGKVRMSQNVREVVKTFGQSSLVSAVAAATDNFNARRFKDQRARLIVLTGGYDECKNPDPAAEIRRTPGTVSRIETGSPVHRRRIADRGSGPTRRPRTGVGSGDDQSGGVHGPRRGAAKNPDRPAHGSRRSSRSR
jgi:hypothetical protein